MRADPASEAPLGTLRAAFERTGTPTWIMRLIRERGLDRAEGFHLELEFTGDGYRGHRQASARNLLAGEVDLIDTDWISIGRMRRDGVPVSAFHPYGRIMGGLVVNATQVSRQGLDGLAGRRIATVSRFDKTWLLLRAFAIERGLADPADSIELVESGSKQAVLARLRAGEVDGAVLFWHQAAVTLSEPRFRLAFDALEAVEALTDAPLPTTFFVASEDRLQCHPERFRAFARAVDAAVAAMRADRALWCHAVGEVASGGPASPLRAAWMRRIGLSWPDRLSQRLTHGCEQLANLLGRSTLGLDTLPEGTFAPGFLAPGEVTT